MILLFWSCLVTTTLALFPGAVPDEGDVRHIYPIRQIVFGLKDHSHALPYLLGWLENLEYPKHRLHVEFYLSGTQDSTAEQISWWKNSVKGLFNSLNIKENEEDWLEAGLRSARMKKLSSVLLLSGNTIPRDDKLFQHLKFNKSEVILCPVFHPAMEGEVWNNQLVDEDTATAYEGQSRVVVNKVSLPLLVNLESTDSSYVTFDFNNLPNYDGSNDYLEVFEASSARMNIPINLVADNYYGVFIDDNVELDDQISKLKYHLCDLVASSKNSPVVSRTVRPWTSEGTLPKRVDKVYLINLKRRDDRLKRMDKMFSILGVQYSLLEASDGKNLDKSLNFKILPGYIDPFHKRPIKSGEVGCFLSHYRIWKDVVDRGLKQVLVFEDDLRFTLNGIEHIEEVLEDLEASKLEWDLIYVGRKKQANDQQDLWVPEHRHLSTVGYSYWTLGYLLSQSGAKKLLDGKPLDNLLPVDEYIPLMFDNHPNEMWKQYFSPRNLKAFTLYPLSVNPQRYTTDEGYVSDTEDSTIIPSTLKETNERDEL
ncbi:unnamed protein product [Auanema sp. JU1783]|nr:unnamed protein product [Auanema sp. JU1783]